MTSINVFTGKEMLIFIEKIYSFVCYFIARIFIDHVQKKIVFDHLRTKRSPFYLKAQVVPRSKHLPPRL